MTDQADTRKTLESIRHAPFRVRFWMAWWIITGFGAVRFERAALKHALRELERISR